VPIPEIFTPKNFGAAHFSSLLAPDLASGGWAWFFVELQNVNSHHRFPLVYQFPFDNQLAVFSLFGSNMMRLDELLIVLGPDRFGIDGSRSQDLQRAWVIASVEEKLLI
jgi:hypothetical protein